MDAAARVLCQESLFNPLITSSYQFSWILVVSHLFHLVLKPLGQPGPVAQILAGLVLGPSLMCRIKEIREFFIQISSADYYRVYAFFSRIFFMFLIGLELDVDYLKRNMRSAGTVAYGGFIISILIGIATSLIVLRILELTYNTFPFIVVVSIVFANSASPVVIRLVAELKLDTSEVGRLAICSSLINEMSGALIFFFYIAFTKEGMFRLALVSAFLTAVLIPVNNYLAFWFNTGNQYRKYIYNSQILIIVVLLIFVCMVIEYNGLYSTFPCFLMGLMFPREGKTARTLLHKLTYAIHNFVLPIYFGFTGFQFDVKILTKRVPEYATVVVILVTMALVSKILGTILACHYLNIPKFDGVILALMLSMKGHLDLITIDSTPIDKTWWGQEIRDLLIAFIVIETMIAGPVVSFTLRRKEAQFAHTRTSIEFLDPESELQMMSCVYAPRNASCQLGLFSAMHGSPAAAITPHFMHLVELPKRRKKHTLMYHQLQDGDQFSDEEEYGGNDVIEVNDAIDIFTSESKLFVRQIKLVSSFPNMYEDVCNKAEDLRVSFIFLPFHMHQRIDGRMENGRDEMRTTNQKIIRHAPCSVGILVDRGCLRFPKLLSPNTVQDVATLFFGGPDDREALACSKRIAMHPQLNLTVIRFLSAATMADTSNPNVSAHVGDEVFRTLSRHDVENDRDNEFVSDFCERFVSSGKIGYAEKHVRNGEETLTVLKDIRDMYSLFIVGKGRRGYSALTTGMSDWEECPELGAVGDLLASMDFQINGSVLVIQQHRHSNQSTSLTDHD